MAQQSPRRLELTVTADQAGEKIDTLLRRELRLSGTVIRRVKWLDDGILLDGMRVTTACRPAAGGFPRTPPGRSAGRRGCGAGP